MVKAVLRGYGQPAPTMPPPEQWGDLMSQAKVPGVLRTLPSTPTTSRRRRRELARRPTRRGSRRRIRFRTPPRARQGALVLAQGLKPLGDHAQREADPDQPVVQDALHASLADGPADQQLGRRLPRSGRRAALIYQSANAMKNNFNTANYKNAKMDELLGCTEPVGRPEDTRRRDQEGASARRGRRAVHPDLVPGHRHGLELQVHVRGCQHVVPVPAVGPGHLGHVRHRAGPTA